MFWQYGERRPTNGWDRLASFGHSSKFQRVSRLGFAAVPMLLNGGQSHFACLAVSWAATLYIILGGGTCPLTKFCQMQNSLCVKVLRYLKLAALLHGTQAVGVSQTLRPSRSKCLVWNYFDHLLLLEIIMITVITAFICPHLHLPVYILHNLSLSCGLCVCASNSGVK